MCILLKLDYAKCVVSNLFSSKSIEEKPLGDRLDSPPPFVKEGLTLFSMGGGGKMAPLRIFAKYLRNALVDLHETL